MGERTGLVMGFLTVNRVLSLSEEEYAHNQKLKLSPRSKFLDGLVISDGTFFPVLQ